MSEINKVKNPFTAEGIDDLFAKFFENRDWRPTVSAGLYTPDRKFIVVEPAKGDRGQYRLVQDGVEEGETAQHAAGRGPGEELGIPEDELKVGKLIGVALKPWGSGREHRDGFKVGKALALFAVEYDGDGDFVLQTDEVRDAFGGVSGSRLEAMYAGDNVHPSTQRLVRDLVAFVPVVPAIAQAPVYQLHAAPVQDPFLQPVAG
jgi:hypothetical protein